MSELGARGYLRDFAEMVETNSIGADGAVWDKGQKLRLESFRADIRKYLVQRWDRFPESFWNVIPWRFSGYGQTAPELACGQQFLLE